MITKFKFEELKENLNEDGVTINFYGKCISNNKKVGFFCGDVCQKNSIIPRDSKILQNIDTTKINIIVELFDTINKFNIDKFVNNLKNKFKEIYHSDDVNIYIYWDKISSKYKKNYVYNFSDENFFGEFKI